MGRLDGKAEAALSRQIEAAEAGRPDALYALGLHYATGNGVPSDYVAAHKWFNLAAMRGVPRAAAERAEIAREMSAAEIALAQRQAREWLAAHARLTASAA